MPICGVHCWRTVGTKERLWAEGEESEESGEGRPVEVESVEE